MIAAVLILTVALTTPYNGSIQLAFAEETADELAAAMGLSPAEISSSDLGTSDHNGTEIQTTPVGNFPTEGDSFAVLSSGCAEDVLLPNNEENHTCFLDGLNTSQGPNQDHDLVQLTLVLNVPEGASKVTFDWKFYSDEFPEFVGSDFNDAFLVEKGNSTFTLSGNNVTAPNNIAFDDNGDLITINTSGDLSMTEGHASGTTYDGATPLLTTTTPVPEGSSNVTLIFSIFDMGDDIYDTTVFVDNVRFDAGGGDGGSTTKKASNLDCTVPATAAVNGAIAVSAALKDATTLDPIANATIDWSVLPSGPTANSTTDSNGEAQASLNLTGLAPGTYTVLASFAGNDAYQVNSCEGTLDVLSEGNNPPVANDDSASTTQNASVAIDILANDSDPDGDSLNVTGVTDPVNGTAIINANGTMTYTPDPGFLGIDEFEYTISDGNSTATAKVTVTVSDILPPPENLPPTAVNDTAQTEANVTVTIDVLANDSDPDGDSLNVTGVADPVNGTAVINGNGTVAYTPDPGFIGTDVFEYTISDANSTATANVTIEVDTIPPPLPDYTLQLFEADFNLTDGTVGVNQEVRAVAATTDNTVIAVTFKWINPSNDTVSEATVPISIGEDTFAPDEPGNWTVLADFGTGEVIAKTLFVDFFVIPESPIGAIAMVMASMGALGGYLYFRSRKPMIDN